jgi:microcystin-dependent protein
MMRKLISLFLVFSLNTYGAAPTGYKNETATAKTYAQDLVFPNNQLTKQAGLDSRVETGNKNLLTNASFEHSTVTTGWTVTNATASADTTNMVEGKKALSLSLTGALTVTQDSTINAANVVGLQGNASIKIKTSNVDGLKVCARNAGVTSTSLCVNVPMDGVWKEINIPFIMTATSNGIAITSTGTSGTVIIDDAFVGTSAPFQNVNGAKLVGTVTITGCSAAWSTTSSTFASFGAQTGCSYATTGEALAPSTNIPAIKFASLPAGNYRLEYEGQAGSATSGQNAIFQFWDGTNTAREQSNIAAGSSSAWASSISQSITYTAQQSNVTLSIRGKVSAGTATIYGVTSQPGTIKVWYFPPESKIYTDFNNGYAENAGEIFYTGESSCPTGSIAGDGSAISRLTYAELFKKFGTTYGVGDGSTTFNLPDLRGIFIRGAGSQTISSILYSGTLGTKQGDQVQGHRHNPLTGTTYMMGNASGGYTSGGSFNTGASTTGDPTTDGTNGTPRTGSETRPANISLTGCIRTNNRNITGSFAGIEKCANDYECTDSFSATIASSGAVSNQNIPWISSCTNPSTGQWDCTLLSYLKDGTSALSNPLKCNVTSDDRNNIGAYSGTTSTATFTLANRTSGATNGTNISVKCQKGTNDYKPKTSKTATSIGVPTVPTPGTKTYDTFSLSYGTTNATTVCSASPCSYLDQMGGAVTSVTRSSTGVYSLNTSKTYSKLKCNYTGYNGINVPIGLGESQLACASSNACSFATRRTDTGALADSFGTIICMGEY